MPTGSSIFDTVGHLCFSLCPTLTIKKRPCAILHFGWEMNKYCWFWLPGIHAGWLTMTPSSQEAVPQVFACFSWIEFIAFVSESTHQGNADRVKYFFSYHTTSGNTDWVLKLAYFCDIFNFLNELTLSLQGKMTTIFKLSDKMAAFKAKLEIWRQRVNARTFDAFHSVAGIIEVTEGRTFILPVGAWPPVAAFKKL